MPKVYAHVAGQTLGSHEAFLKKLTKRGVKIVDSPEESDWTIVFCPIVSGYQTDIDAALSSVPGETSGRKLILVAMHHSFNKDYIFPKSSEDHRVKLCVDCLFFDNMGLYKCPSNKEAVKKVCKQLDLKKFQVPKIKKVGKKTKTKSQSDK